MEENIRTVRHGGRVIAFVPCPCCGEEWNAETETWTTIYARIDHGSSLAVCPDEHESEVPPSLLMELNGAPMLMEVEDEPS